MIEYRRKPEHRRPTGRIGLFGVNGRGPRRRKPINWRKVFSWAAIVGVALLFAGAIAMVAIIAWVSRNLPDPNQINDRNLPQTTTIYDRTGEHVLYQIHGVQKRTVVELKDISKNVINATIAAEDRDFYEHKGISITGMIRGFLRNIVRKEGENLQSGSTITQQFIKKSIFTDRQTYTRKVKEVILALEIERRLSKDQILQLYLNEIPYGSVAYGIQSAAQTFLGKDAKDLTVSEAALLASLPKGTTLYSPYGNNLDLLISRQHYILAGMVSEGYITQEEADEAKKDDVLARIKPKREPITAPHFVFYVKQMLAETYGDVAVERDGLKIITTLDMEKQVFAEEAIADNAAIFEKWKADTAALAAIDARNGDVLAMVGSRDFFDDEHNGQFNSLLGKLQPGSSIKPIVYAAAFEKGYTPSTVVEDVKTEFSSGTSYSPNNYDFSERGPITLKSALAGSLNIPAVKVLYLTGFAKFEDFASRIGYTTFKDRSSYGLSLVLGGAVVRPLEHINAYTAFAQEGVWHPSRAILKVMDKTGKVLEDHTEEKTGKKAFDPEVARQINDIMSDNAARAYVFGEKNHLTLPDRPVAAKTGTTNNNKDAWTVGFTPSLVAGVWVGNSEGAEMKSGADGSVVAAPIWNQFMRKALAGTKVETFTPPQPVVTGKPVLDGDLNAQTAVKVDRASGKLATALTPPEYVEERRYGAPHSILFFVNKDDPRGPVPERPEEDPQFAEWEKALAAWSEKKGIVQSDLQPPTEFDDVHVQENMPTISFIQPSDNASLNDRVFSPQVSASSRRGVVKVEYRMDGDLIGTVGYPYGNPLTIPNRVAKGYHTLTATALDDVGNATSTSVTVNLTADAGPLGIEWSVPYPSQYVSRNNFPFTVKFRLDDLKSIESLAVSAVSDSDSSKTYSLGSVDKPPLPNVTMTWNDAPPSSGRYNVLITAKLTSGETKTEQTWMYVD